MESFSPSDFTDLNLTPQQLDLDALARFICRSAELYPEKEWLSVSIPVQDVDPLAYIEQLPESNQIYYWEKPDQEFAIATGGTADILRSTGKNRFRDISRLTRRLQLQTASFSSLNHPLASPFLIGGYSFSDYNIRKEWASFGAARFVLPEWSILREGDLHLLTLTLRLKGQSVRVILEQLHHEYSRFLDHSAQICSYHQGDNSQEDGVQVSSGSLQEWRKQVEKSRELIRKGTFQKIVIARKIDLETDRPIRISRALYHLREHFPGCTTFLVRSNDGPAFIGATPERLISLRHNRVLTEGLAGSISRGESASEDSALEHRLMESLKDRSEHDFVVRDIRANLEPLSRDLEHPALPRIKKLDNVQHLFTPIRARARNNITIHELAGTLHPTPAVGGYPRAQAIPYIEEIETIDRGWYAGPIGWANLNGDGEFSVAIRSALVNGTKASLFAGCGIVADSDPDREWEETQLKFAPLLNALKQAAS
ncbi:MAG: isochorismate synthase [Balneolaceae bacterium]